MDALTLILMLLAGGVALVVHRRVPVFGAACLIAAYCTAAPSLVLFDLGGGSKTDFAPFNLFVLFGMDLLISALVGIPFWWRRKGQTIAQPSSPVGKTREATLSIFTLQHQSWSLQAGIATALLCALLLNALLFFALNPSQFAAPNLPLAFIFILLFVAALAVLLGGAILNLLFQAGVRVTGYQLAIPAKHAFWIGFSLSASLLLLFALSNSLVPPAWNQGVHRLSFELVINWLCFAPLLLGRQYANHMTQQMGTNN